MAELSALSSSPPADPHTTPSGPLPSSVAPKSSLCNDVHFSGITPTSPLTPPPPTIPAETPVGNNHTAAPQKEEAAEPGSLVEANMPQPESPSPDLSPGPNLYPSVHVTQNPPAAANITAAPSVIPPVPPVESKRRQAPKSPPPPVSPKPQSPIKAAPYSIPTPQTGDPSPTVALIQDPTSHLTPPSKAGQASPTVSTPIATVPLKQEPASNLTPFPTAGQSSPTASHPTVPLIQQPETNLTPPPRAGQPSPTASNPSPTVPLIQQPETDLSPPPRAGQPSPTASHPNPTVPLIQQPETDLTPPPRAAQPSPTASHPNPTVPLIQEPETNFTPPPRADQPSPTVPLIQQPETNVTPPPRAGQPSPTVPIIQEPSLPPPGAQRPAPDTLSYLESASMMSGTLESLSGLGDDASSFGSDSEINGLAVRRTDKYGFLAGNQFSDASDKEVGVEVSRQREVKWLEMFNHWDKWIKHRFQKVKIRCRKGIPSSLRSKAWQLLSNSQELLDTNPGKFEELEREPGEAKWLDIIEKDLHRQFPFHEMFAARGGHGQQDLYRILKAYTIYRPDEGYCQAQAPVAAVLLMHMPAEQAFWCLVQICEKYLPGYYSAGLEAIQLDGEIFFSLLRRSCPMAYRHLKKFKIDPILYMTEWFMCIFSRTLPWACVLRVWDMFFCEGVKIVFRVGLVLLKQMLGSVDKLREVQGMYETMERLRGISPETIREDNLVQEVILLQVTEALIERECTVQVRKWRESRGELTHQSGRRLHGTRAIYEQKRRASAISSGGSFSFLASSVPPPGPLRASSSLLSLPGFRKSRTPFHSNAKKGSFSGPSFSDGGRPQSPPAAQKPPIPPGAAQRALQVQSPLVGAGPRGGQSAQAPDAMTPAPRIVSEQITPVIPSPTANNAPLLPGGDIGAKGAPDSPPATPPPVEEDGRRKKKSKEDKKKEREDEKKRLKEKKEKDKAEKERLKKDKERLEKEKKKAGKKKDKVGAAPGPDHDKNGAARDSASLERGMKKEAQ